MAARPTIIIFGAAVRPDGSPSAALRRRVEAALACAREAPDAVFIPTGGIGRHGPSEAEVMAALLRRSGIPRERIRLEPTGRDTLSSVRAVCRLLRGDGPVHVATSTYHLPRCLVLFRLAGVPARPCPPPPGAASRRFCRRWYWRLREVLALPVDTMLMLALRMTGRI